MKKIEVVIADADVEKVVRAVCQAVQFPALGDGKMFIYDVEDVVRLPNGGGAAYSQKPFDIEEFLRSQKY